MLRASFRQTMGPSIDTTTLFFFWGGGVGANKKSQIFLLVIEGLLKPWPLSLENKSGDHGHICWFKVEVLQKKGSSQAFIIILLR